MKIFWAIIDSAPVALPAIVMFGILVACPNNYSIVTFY